MKVTDKGDGTLAADVTYSPEDKTITNTYTPETTEVTVTKKWEDDSNRDHKRPEELELTLNGAPAGFKVPAPAVTKNGNNWTYTWTGIPKNWDGEEIKYTVTEGNVPEGYTCTGSPAAAGGIITNSYEPEKTSIDVVKEWIDEDNASGSRPSRIQVQLTADGEPEGEPVTLDAEHEWKHTWTGLPRNKDGAAIEYSVQELSVDHYVSSVSREGNVITVKNSALLKHSYSSGDNETIIDGQVVQVGTVLEYKISYTNVTGEDAALTITDKIPAYTTFVEASDGGQESDGTVTWNLEVKAGESIAVTFKVKINDDANDKKITNQANVRIGDNDYTTTEVTNPTPGDEPSEPTGEGNLVVKKTLEGRKLEAGEFSFRLTPADGAPGEEQTAANDADGNVKFSEITFRKVGDYQYRISEVPGELGGVTYSEAEYTAIAEVRQDEKDKTRLVVTWKIDGREDKTAEFVNKYEAKGSVKLEARKKLTGTATDLPAGAFTFVLEGDDIEKQEKTNAADGTVVFDEIEYTKSADMDGKTEVTKTYKITEKNEKVECYTYDEHEAKVTVTISDDGKGSLICKASYSDGDTAVFTNGYVASGSVPVTASKDLTGRDLEEGEFSFTLTQVDKDGNPVEDGTVLKAENDESGKVDFGMIEYTQEDMVDDGTESGTAEEASGEDQNPAGNTADAEANKDAEADKDAEANKDVEATEDAKAAEGETAENAAVTKDADADENAEAAENSAAQTETTTRTRVYTKVTKEAEPTTKVRYIYNDEDGNEKTTDELPEGAEDNGDGTYTVTKTVKETVEVEIEVPAEKAAEAEAAEESEAEAETEEAEETEEKETEASATAVTTVEVEKEVETVYTRVEETIPGEQKVVYVYTDENGEEKTVSELPEGAEDNGDGTYTVTETENSKHEHADKADKEKAPEASESEKAVKTPKASEGETAADAAEEPEKKYAAVKTFYYEITEDAGGLGGVDYDDHKEILKVTVVNNGDGTLTATAEYDEDGASFVNTYTAGGSATFKGKKTLKNHDLADGQFEFTLTPVDDAPGEKQTVVNSGDGSITFDKVAYTEADAGKTYTYWITEVNSNSTGYIYDSRTVEATVKITDKGDGSLSCDITYSDGSEAAFENSYKALSTSLSLKAVKQLEGRDLVKGEFEFILSDESGKEIGKAANSADGTVAFSDILIDKEGTYTYYVKEVAGNKTGVTYDKSRYTYVVKVEDVDGRLTVTGIEANDADRGETATFVNKYTPPKTPDKPDKPDKPSKPSRPSNPSNPSNPQRRNPPTGDSSNVMLWLILLAGAAAAVGTLIYVRRKNREEDEKAA